MESITNRSLFTSGAASLLLVVAGCAGNQEIPTASMTQAEENIEEAERVEAQRYANRELNMARESLEQARAAQREGDEELAVRLAERAAIDADYAAAVAENEEMQEAVQELRDTLATLESELARDPQSAPQQDSGRPSTRF
ncbi:MAG: DUF4398 domain-containing protein [Gammaproteobacteria bacterium]|nr:DUF4398 domain-containing protein [Gammaproteobacteria bacterium]